MAEAQTHCFDAVPVSSIQFIGYAPATSYAMTFVVKSDKLNPCNNQPDYSMNLQSFAADKNAVAKELFEAAMLVFTCWQTGELLTVKFQCGRSLPNVVEIRYKDKVAKITQPKVSHSRPLE